jgi:hypothetical protein
MGTAEDWNAEDYRRQRPKSWCPLLLAGLLAVLVGVARLAGVAVDRIKP